MNLEISENDCRLKLTNIAKRFGRTILFKKISFEISSGEIIAITGWNGSGKSTLLRIIAGLIRPTRGQIDYLRKGMKINADERRNFIGMVAPALAMYDELSALENLEFLAKVRGLNISGDRYFSLLDQIGLKGWENANFGIYSSGMKQRLKIIQAILHRPPLLLLDEPFSNLDTKGIDAVDKIIHQQKNQAMTIIASNEQREIDYADRIINLSE